MRKMRMQDVEIADKIYTVKESKVKELRGMFESFTEETDKAIGANKAKDLSGMVNEFIGGKLTEVFPGLTPEDLDEAYPSEIEELVGAFIAVNFTGLKKVGTPIANLFLKGMQAKIPTAVSAEQPAK
jgi:hypothetical protein